VNRLSVVRAGIRSGLIVGVGAVFIVLIGMVQTFAKRYLTGDITLAMVILLTFGLAAGVLAARQMARSSPELGPKVLAAAISGLTTGVMLAGLLLVVSQVSLREVLVNATPEMVAALSFGLPLSGAAGLLTGISVAMAVIAVLSGLLPPRLRRALLEGLMAVILIGLFWEAIIGLDVSRLVMNFLGVKAGKVLPLPGGIGLLVVVSLVTYLLRARPRPETAVVRQRRSRAWRSISLVLIAGVMAALPFAVGLFWSQTLTTIGLFTLMGLGLNIVVGMAGLLDLGYVAFYAIGAYTMALFSSPASSLQLGLPFWVALPIALVFAAISGILLGIPVLRLRGDYLAIVTLGFGEIIRILALSDMLKPYIGGPQGIMETPPPYFFGVPLSDPRYLYYLILAACLVVVFISLRLNDSRIGRAWIAVREDEDVAQAMGINLRHRRMLCRGGGGDLRRPPGRHLPDGLHPVRLDQRVVLDHHRRHGQHPRRDHRRLLPDRPARSAARGGRVSRPGLRRRPGDHDAAPARRIAPFGPATPGTRRKSRGGGDGCRPLRTVVEQAGQSPFWKPKRSPNASAVWWPSTKLILSWKKG